jgi:hypothetical protein
MSEPSIDQIERFFDKCVFGFMFHDIEAAIDGKANYLAALGLVAYTEFMGGLVNGTLGQRNKSKARFYAFWNRMGAEYRSVAVERALVKIYSNVRSGLVHSYFIAQDSVVKMTKGDGHGQRCGVEVVEPGGKVMFIVEKYFDDFKSACRRYHRELVKQRDPELIQRFEQAVGEQWFFNELIDGVPHD